MRNIHVIPTDKPSRLHITSKLRLYPNGLTPKSQGLCKNQNMYITSDEIVTEYSTGLYFIDVYTGRNDVFSPIKIDKDSIHAAPFHSYMNNGNMCKKIILTTDQDLIKDGVQAIDDIFLEWFVKNPSCEEVEVDVTTLELTIRPSDNIPLNSGDVFMNTFIPEKIKQSDFIKSVFMMLMSSYISETVFLPPNSVVSTYKPVAVS